MQYKDENTELIRRAINVFNWQRGFSNTCTDKKVDIFKINKLNIMSNIASHETVLCDDNDIRHGWITK